MRAHARVVACVAIFVGVGCHPWYRLDEVEGRESDDTEHVDELLAKAREASAAGDADEAASLALDAVRTRPQADAAVYLALAGYLDAAGRAEEARAVARWKLEHVSASDSGTAALQAWLAAARGGDGPVADARAQVEPIDVTPVAPVTPPPVTPPPVTPPPAPPPTLGSSSLTPSAAPLFGEAALAPGFQPDPHAVAVRFGGPIHATSASAECRGWVTGTPTFRVSLPATMSLLRIYAVASADTTLVVNDAAGNWLCADDTFGINPSIDLANAGPGSYDVWVGSYAQAAAGDATLYVTELATSHP